MLGIKPAKRRASMDSETRLKMRKIYYSDIKKLEEILGRDLSMWYNGL